MTGRTNIILGAVLAVQIAAIVARALWGGGPAPGTARGLLLEGVDAQAIHRVVIETREEGGAVHVERETVDAPWLVREAAGYPADAGKVADTIRELMALEIADVVSTSDAHFEDLKVGEASFDRRLTVEGAGEPVTILFGAGGRANSVHARRVGTDAVYAVRNYSSWKLSPQSDAWIDRTYFSANRQLVLRAAITNPRGSFRLEREGQDWHRVGADGQRTPLDNDKVDELLGKAGRVTMSEVAGRVATLPDAMAAPVAEIVLALRAAPQARDPGAGGAGVPPTPTPSPPPAPAIAETRVLKIAKKPGDQDAFYLHREGSHFIAESSTWSVKALLEVTPADLERRIPPTLEPVLDPAHGEEKDGR